ncbi:hypothetical protein ACWEPC_05890 [Nonomuraea sp. NPDC004297]
MPPINLDDRQQGRLGRGIDLPRGGPGGGGNVAVVDRGAFVVGERDLGPGEHANRTYDLTGPRSLTMTEVAAILSRTSGRTITYQAETEEAAYRSRASYGAPDWQVEAWVSTYTAIAAGQLDGVSGDIPRLTGHAATPLADVVGAPQKG